MTTRRTLLARRPLLAGGAAALSALAACGAPRSEAPAQTRPAGKLEFYDWWLPASSPLQDAWWKFVKEDFERKNPGVTVEFNFISGTSGVRDKLKTAAAADTPPDGSHASVAFVRSLWDAGLLEDLTPYAAKTPDVSMNRFLDAALFYNQKSGKVYGLPMEGPDADAFFYNKSHFQEVGLDPASDKTSRWTYDDLIAAATKLTKGSGPDVLRRGLLPHGISTGNVAAWLYTNGATWYGKDNLSVAFNTPQGVQVIEYLLDLRKRFPEPPSFAGLSGDQQFYQQKTSIVPQGNYNVHVVRSFAPEVEFDMMPLPKGPAGKSPSTKVWMNQVIMPKNAKRKDLGWLFMAYYAGKEVIAKRMTLLNRMGPRKDFFESNEWKEETKKIPALNQAPKIAAAAGQYPFIMYSEVDEVIAPIFTKIQGGAIGARDGLAEIEREANRVLGQQPR
ncbi:MAG TPA: sugar ABC transporter substrate-binding protein [Chloroflexota bacterium]|nr:sugar ABC transporter substrate-binding protein [Chloroflexota bacterium]